MSKITLEPNDSGAGTFSIVSPDSNINRTLTLPDESGTILNTDSNGNVRVNGINYKDDPDTNISFDDNLIKFSTEGSEAARIDSSGNLLVGTTVSEAPLTVDGTISSTDVKISVVKNNRNVVNKKIESFDRANEKILLLISDIGDARGVHSGTFIIGAASDSSSLNRVGCQTLFINAGASSAAFDEVVISGFESAQSDTVDGSFKDIDMKIVTLIYEGNTWLALYLPNRSTDSRRDTFAEILFNGVYVLDRFADVTDSLTWVTESDVSSISTVLDQSNNWVNTRSGASRIGN